jgi:hypothetical protein
MKVIKVSEEIFKVPSPELQVISARLDTLGRGHHINLLNWKNYDYRPDVRFNIAYGLGEIFIKYYITEDYFKAEKTGANEKVSEDSCVEFFVSPANDGIYYNFEFNAIGTCLAGSGSCRHDNIKVPVEIISGIRRLGSFNDGPGPEEGRPFSWTLTIAIPLETFFLHGITELKGKTFRANFYKCGDKLIIPHYLTWNRVGTDKPDFHQPEYFGVLKFI